MTIIPWNSPLGNYVNAGNQAISNLSKKWVIMKRALLLERMWRSAKGSFHNLFYHMLPTSHLRLITPALFGPLCLNAWREGIYWASELTYVEDRCYFLFQHEDGTLINRNGMQPMYNETSFYERKCRHNVKNTLSAVVKERVRSTQVRID